MKSVEGPVGPHLFRMSQETSRDVDIYLTLSPPASPEEYRAPPPQKKHKALENYSEPPRTSIPLRTWTPQQVAEWMYSTGFDRPICDTFFINDISGITLIDLQYDDLKELGITSFGQRHRLWTEIKTLKDSKLPAPGEEPFFSQPDIPRNVAVEETVIRKCSTPETPVEETMSPTTGRRRGRNRHGDIISPAESASIVAIEQLLPKPHKCSKGENCSKWQKQQRKLARIATEFPLEVAQIQEAKGSPVESGVGQSIVASIGPSIIASSDLFGPQKPKVKLEEDNLRGIQARDPQESVRQFLNFQHLSEKPDDPMTPPYEMFPPLSPPKAQLPHANLRLLPKLMIPDEDHSPQTFSSNRTAMPARNATPLTALNMNQRAMVHDIYRLGSPASEMDVPVTAVPIGPIERDFSSSVPPDMRYGGGEILSRSSSRLGHRPPVPSFSQPFSPIRRSTSHAGGRGKQASVVVHAVPEEVEGAPTEIADDVTPTAEKAPGFDGPQHQGWMKKRRTRMLRHEWNEHHFRLKGNQLAMHSDDQAIDALDYIDVDDYAVAISTGGAGSKLNSAFKRLHLNGGKGKGLDPGAFAFQLTPAAERKGVLHAATAKTHHFAVKTQNERIDWMRELMLARAKRQKDAVCASFE